jgi:hypothetical protein
MQEKYRELDPKPLRLDSLCLRLARANSRLCDYSIDS